VYQLTGATTADGRIDYGQYCRSGPRVLRLHPSPLNEFTIRAFHLKSGFTNLLLKEFSTLRSMIGTRFVSAFVKK